jgi:hypothetical protein
MKSFYLNFNLNKEDGKTVQFIEDIEDFEASFNVETDEGTLTPVFDYPIGTIYIDSTGGENRMTSMLYDFLNTRKSNYRFVVVGDFSSNAIILILALNPKHLIINRQANATIHLSNYNHPVNELAFNNEDALNIADYKSFKEYLTLLLNMYKMFLTKEELAHVKKGNDVSLNSERVAETFRKLKRNKEFQKKCKNIFEITL